MGEKVLPAINRSKNLSWVHGKKKQKKNSKRIKAPKNFNIQEGQKSSDDANTKVEKGGAIDLGKPLDPLERLERLEKLKTRKFITYSIVPFSIIWVLVGIIHYLLSGNFLLLTASSPMSGPILIIMGYYFGDGLLQRYLNRGHS